MDFNIVIPAVPRASTEHPVAAEAAFARHHVQHDEEEECLAEGGASAPVCAPATCSALPAPTLPALPALSTGVAWAQESVLSACGLCSTESCTPASASAPAAAAAAAAEEEGASGVLAAVTDAIATGFGCLGRSPVKGAVVVSDDAPAAKAQPKEEPPAEHASAPADTTSVVEPVVAAAVAPTTEEDKEPSPVEGAAPPVSSEPGISEAPAAPAPSSLSGAAPAAEAPQPELLRPKVKSRETPRE